MHTKKKSVSLRKYRRILNNPAATPCQSFRYRCNKYESEASLESYKLGDFVYCLFKTNKSKSDRFKICCMRYWVGDHDRVDLFAYVKTISVKI